MDYAGIVTSLDILGPSVIIHSLLSLRRETESMAVPLWGLGIAPIQSGSMTRERARIRRLLLTWLVALLLPQPLMFLQFLALRLMPNSRLRLLLLLVGLLP